MAEHAITPAMINTEVITTHLLKDQTLARILDPQAEGVAQSLCNLLNLIVDSKAKEETEDEFSDMEQDEKCDRDHENAIEQIDGTVGAAKAARRRRGKQVGNMDHTTTEAGKRNAKEAGTEEPPAPKCLQLPTTPAAPVPQIFDIAKGDDPTKESAAAVAKATAAAKKS